MPPNVNSPGVQGLFRLIDEWEHHDVILASVTQQFSTTKLACASTACGAGDL